MCVGFVRGGRPRGSNETGGPRLPGVAPALPRCVEVVPQGSSHLLLRRSRRKGDAARIRPAAIQRALRARAVAQLAQGADGKAEEIAGAHGEAVETDQLRAAMKDTLVSL